MFKPKGVIFLTVFITLMAFGCSGPDSDQTLLLAELPLHLEEHLDDARIEGSEVPDDLPAPIEWNFNEPQPDWKPVKLIWKDCEAIKPIQIDDGLRLPLTTSNQIRNLLGGGIYITLPDWNFKDWEYVEVYARTSDPMQEIAIVSNYTEDNPVQPGLPFLSIEDAMPLVSNNTDQTYRLTFNRLSMRRGDGPLTDLGIVFTCQAKHETAALDILSVRVVHKEQIYADAPLGVKTVERAKKHRRTLYTHAPGRIEYRIRIPQDGRLDVGLGVIKEDYPVTFRVVASRKNEEVTLFEETYSNPKEWIQHSVDLSSFAGKTVNLALEVEAKPAGTVALWSAPTLTGKRSTQKPNIIFYIIDGAGAGDMSVYGYNRRTTPNIERLAAEGAIFEQAYSNSSWTKVSNPSFMTSLYHSILGGYKSDSDPLPDQAVTMAQHLHRVDYQTGVFVSNSYAGTLTSFDRGVDFLREDKGENKSVSSRGLHEKFWEWRAAYPREPYWVHFQTTDLHGPSWKAEAPFSGLFISPQQRQRFYEWQRQMKAAGYDEWGDPYEDVWEKTGIHQLEFSYSRRCLYDETMAHNDYQIGQLVKRLKTAGEWDNTLLIIAADHGHEGAGCTQLDPLPPKWGSPLFASFRTRIPMIFIWPERIAPGQRFSQQVSMIDMLPTILDLAGLPMPEVMQGQSLAPLLLGEEGWEQRSVILDEFYIDRKTGELNGKIEVVDGRWGASLTIGQNIGQEGFFPPQPRPAPLLLYDLWNDPYCLHSLHEQRPDLVEKYTKFLEAQWKVHQTLAQHFTRSKDSPLTPEQLETLRALGYIR